MVKALHLLSPDFFPLWDEAIAKDGYECNYTKDPLGQYLCFIGKIKDNAERLDKDEEVKLLVGSTHKKLIKLIDEYNYVTHTLPALARKAEKAKAKRVKLKKKAGR